ncbi:MAG: hypothetical protein HGA38_03605 [Candidatus Moranbacteria bacterium]|nr:hypothetical protein [Candidatus Moranbacteria bacterium]
MPFKEYLLDRSLLPEPYSTAQKAETYDCVIPQAYGRNTFENRVLPMIRKRRDDFGSDIAMFRWLHDQGFDSGEPNRFISESCYQAVELLGRHVPVIGQWEVMFALWKAYPQWYESNTNTLVAIWPAECGRQNTYELLLEAMEVCKTRNVSVPLIPAAPQHTPRTFFLAKKIFGTSPAVVKRYPDEDPNHWYDPKSVQWQTRSERLWLLYESLSRIHHHLFGWL